MFIHSLAPKSIRGIDVVASTTVVVVPGSPLTYDWKGHGFKIDIPTDALDPSDPPMDLTITASLSGSFKLPDNTKLVSGVYWLSFPKHFLNPVTIKVQHCALVDHHSQSSSLSFVTAKCTQKTLPYDFKTLSGGNFSSEICYGTIEMSHFSGTGVVSSNNQKYYVALTWYIPYATFVWLMYFIIIPDLNLYFKVLF